MAGTFTHWMIVEDALDKFDKLPQKHKYFAEILNKDHFVKIGAAGPDYPYLDEVLKGFFKYHSWADRMHYENTNDFVLYGLKNLSQLEGEFFHTSLSWLCGFVSHLIADSFIHPVVNSIVGPYMFNSTEHRHCEMIQDSFIFNLITNTEISYAAGGIMGYLDLLKMCSDPNNENCMHPVIRDFWIATLKMSHPGGDKYFNRIEPDDWHKSFLSKIETVSEPIAFFRHIGEELNLVYRRTDEITDKERKKFIDEVKLPGGKIGKFKEDAFDKAVDEIIKVWQKLFVDVENKDSANCKNYIKNWNLDSGVDDDNCYYWV